MGGQGEQPSFHCQCCMKRKGLDLKVWMWKAQCDWFWILLFCFPFNQAQCVCRGTGWGWGWAWTIGSLAVLMGVTVGTGMVGGSGSFSPSAPQPGPVCKWRLPYYDNAWLPVIPIFILLPSFNIHMLILMLCYNWGEYSKCPPGNANGSPRII